MAALARLQSSSCANPVLDLFTAVSGLLTDVYSIQYQIFDKSSGTSVQIFPPTPGDKALVDVADDCPTGDHLDTGHYVARWDVPGNENLGAHQIQWFFQLTSSSPVQTYIEEFEILAEVVGSADGPDSSYAFVQDFRDEGLTNTDLYSDAYLQQRITLASRMIERATKRFFYPKSMAIKVNGSGGPKILLSDPIIAVSEVLFDVTPWEPSATLIEPDLLRIYNRHLTQQLTSPDDRNNPKIELFNPAMMLRHYGSVRSSYSSLVFPPGQQNVSVTGVFGYTEFDGSSTGKTPDLIRHACKLLVFREIDRMSKTAARFDRHVRQRLTSERTRDQAYTLEPLGSAKGFFTGDPEIDNILAIFLRPPAFGAA